MLTASEKALVDAIVLPVDPSPFQLSDIRRAIPAHCFERSYLRSFGQVFFDIGLAFIVFRLSFIISSPLIPQELRYVLWPIYYYAQGCVLMGIWVMAHECGHGSFSESRLVNDITGLILHSMLLVPYFSWKHTHSVHHQNTCSIDRDEAYVPHTPKDLNLDNPYRFTLPFRIIHSIVYLTLGFPLYLSYHLTGHKYPTRVNHFNPYSACFVPKNKFGVILNDFALVVVCFGLYKLCTIYGTIWILNVYVGPYVVMNMWLVLITHLQHTDVHVPHYRGKEFTWLRGALATVDRDFGWILNALFHHLQDTHVVHHLFSAMPFYHAEEASLYVTPFLGKFHLSPKVNSSVAAAFWESFRQCIYVPSEGGIVFYRSVHKNYEKDE